MALIMSIIKFKPDNKVAYDKTPIQFKAMPGVREKLKTIPDWQKRLREFVDSMIVDVDKK
jgi:hypothetical protein